MRLLCSVARRPRPARGSAPVAVVPVAVALALLVAACSSDAASTSSTTAEPSASTTSTSAAPEPTGRPSTGCGTSEATTQDRERIDVVSSEVDRYYLRTVPDAHDGVTPLPLVVDLHGLIEGAQLHSEISRMSELALEEGFVTVFPHGTGDVVSWKVQRDRSGNPDLVFLDEVLDQLGAELCIDVGRVFVTGLSNGAMLTSAVACTMSDRVAAVAPVAGAIQMPDCELTRPVPIVTFHGTVDPLLPFNGNSSTGDGSYDLEGDGYPASMRDWADRNGCDATPVDTDVTERVLHRVWPCPEGVAVEFYVLVGGGHDWPGNPGIGSISFDEDDVVLDIDATALMWEFFQRFELP